MKSRVKHLLVGHNGSSLCFHRNPEAGTHERKKVTCKKCLRKMREVGA